MLNRSAHPPRGSGGTWLSRHVKTWKNSIYNLCIFMFILVTSVRAFGIYWRWKSFRRRRGMGFNFGNWQGPGPGNAKGPRGRRRRRETAGSKKGKLGVPGYPAVCLEIWMQIPFEITVGLEGLWEKKVSMGNNYVTEFQVMQTYIPGNLVLS